MRILIVGAGISGLAFASFIKRDGTVIDIVDKAPAWPNRGFSIGFWSNARAVLQKLGLGEKFDEHAVPFHRLIIRNGDGKLLRQFNLHKFNTEVGLALVDLKRSLLHDWLYETAGKPAVRLGKSLLTLREEGNKVHVVFSDGEQQNYDLVVGADGIHSQVRTLSLNFHERYKNWRAWWMWVNGSFGESRTLSSYVEPGVIINFFNEGERTLVNLAAHANHAVWDTEAGRMERLTRLFKSESSLVPLLFEGHKDVDAMPTDLVRIKLKHWHTNRIVLIGDAAHGFEPSAGLGGSMALEDAYVLAAELLKVEEEHITAALEAYEKKRKPRVALARSLTSKMGSWGMVDSVLLRKSIDLIFPYLPESMLTRDFFKLLKEEI
ncbi:MAG: 2-polyprenyl-6-methoxyphenol hydroxylase-like oxidoreductase [Parcubacteria group bacterium Gr01-1014_8]|nr:MAG: 2-polyprenyl-6-methoxyphenol hydroxylase-like oxidoreductase [Parcubacteria group bacterium Gr01-1014_8]